jgi:hypothetical protein
MAPMPRPSEQASCASVVCGRVHTVSTQQAKFSGKTLGRRADHLMNDQGVGIRRVFELQKFP